MRALVEAAPAPPHVLVPVGRLDRPMLLALAFARSISSDVTAVHVTSDRLESLRVRERWRRRDDGISLDIIESSDRATLSPLLAYIDETARRDPARPIAVVVPEFMPPHPWEYLLHNWTARWLKLRLFRRPNTVVITVPYRAPRRV